jgi:hypothetical protein
MSKASNAARIVELESAIKRFDTLTGAAAKDKQFTAAVNASSRMATLQKELHALRQEIEAADIADPLERLESLRQRAAAEGSWVAAAQFGAQLDALRIRAEADKTNEAARVLAVSKDATDVEFLTAALNELMTMQAESTGLQKIQALRAAVGVREQLTAAIKAAEGQGEMSDAEVRLAIEDQIPDIPDEHLALYVRGYCERHKLPMPHRSVSGGRAN